MSQSTVTEEFDQLEHMRRVSAIGRARRSDGYAAVKLEKAYAKKKATEELLGALGLKPHKPLKTLIR